MLDINFSRFFLKIFVKRISLEKYIVESKKLKPEKGIITAGTQGKKIENKKRKQIDTRMAVRGWA